jgi:hydroxymethylpyrimidine/phosphomethylpyrimidine kinase
MNLLSVAGFDPSAGAGVLLDLNVFQSLGYDGAAVLTALTVQNTAAVFRIKALEARFIRAQAEALGRDMTFAGLKIGMIGSSANLREIGRLLGDHAHLPRVVDPILRASSGRRLLESSAVDRFLKTIENKASVLTPNLDEAARLSGRAVRTIADMRAAAEMIFSRTNVPCLIKGGHLPGPAVNILFDGRKEIRYRQRRLAKDVHGTGCLFSAALLGFLVRTGDLSEAGRLATDWTHIAIRTAKPVGRGRAVFDARALPRS